MVLGRVKKFLIEDDYYLIPEERDWAIARFRGVIRKDGSDDIDYLTFHRTIEQAKTRKTLEILLQNVEALK